MVAEPVDTVGLGEDRSTFAAVEGEVRHIVGVGRSSAAGTGAPDHPGSILALTCSKCRSVGW